MMVHIIDMNNVLIRYCFAIPEKLSPDGILVNGIYGFLRFLKRLNGDSIICCLDKCSSNFRKDIYTDYKKTRLPIDNRFYTQISLMESICNNLGIETLSHRNFEADDLIATVVNNPSNKYTVYSTDKDLLQLCIHDHVKVVHPFSKETLDHEFIKKKYHIDVKDFTMFLALAGDVCDNIPGIRGVGPKTAVKIINEGIDAYKHKFDFSELETMIELVKLKSDIDIVYKTNKIDKLQWDLQMELLGFQDLI